MGHQPGFPCLYTPDDHTGRCSTPVIPPPADLDRTRYFEAASSISSPAYWRSNVTAPRGQQVEFRHPDGQWKTSLVFDTETALLRDLRRFEAGFPWREITAEEVPSDASPDPEAA